MCFWLSARWVDSETGMVVIKDHTLTGYHIFEDETLDSAASRIFKKTLRDWKIFTLNSFILSVPLIV